MDQQAGEADAGERGAILYAVIEGYRWRGVDPFAYLRKVLTRLPKMTNHQVVDLLPPNWARVSKVRALLLSHPQMWVSNGVRPMAMASRRAVLPPPFSATRTVNHGWN